MVVGAWFSWSIFCHPCWRRESCYSSKWSGRTFNDEPKRSMYCYFPESNIYTFVSVPEISL